jgi:pimeloyl-ACP methyl ester carboxylesterase
MNISRFNFEVLAKIANIYEISPGDKTGDYSFLSAMHKQITKINPKIGGAMIMPFTGTHPSFDDHSRFELLFKLQFDSSSLRCLEHFRQLRNKVKNSVSFTKYDYGNKINLEKYGQPNAPEYDFNLLKVPTHLITGKDDPLSSIEDNCILHDQLKALGKNVDLKVVDNCSHVSFQWGKQVDWMHEYVDSSLNR